MIEIKHESGHIWMPVRTKPRQEKKLKGYCEGNDIFCYLPLRKKVKRYGRRTVESFLPMFPGYIFCNLNEEKYQNLVCSNCVVYRITIDKAGEETLLAELDNIQVFERASDVTDVIVKPELVEGSSVLINSGPMKGVSGIIKHRKGKTVVTINMDFLQQSISAEFDAEDIDADDDS